MSLAGLHLVYVSRKWLIPYIGTLHTFASWLRRGVRGTPVELRTFGVRKRKEKNKVFVCLVFPGEAIASCSRSSA